MSYQLVVSIFQERNQKRYSIPIDYPRFKIPLGALMLVNYGLNMQKRKLVFFFSDQNPCEFRKNQMFKIQLASLRISDLENSNRPFVRLSDDRLLEYRCHCKYKNMFFSRKFYTFMDLGSNL